MLVVDIIIAVFALGIAVVGLVRWRQTRAASNLGSMLLGLALTSNMTSIVIQDTKAKHVWPGETATTGLTLSTLGFMFLAASAYCTWGPPSRKGRSHSTPR